MQEEGHFPGPKSLVLPEHLLGSNDGQFTQLLFDALSSAVLYLDKWGRIVSANTEAKKLFGQEDLQGKTVLEFLSGWEDPMNCHHEVLMVARTGTSLFGAIEKAEIHGKQYWFQTDKVSIRDGDDEICGVLLT